MFSAGLSIHVIDPLNRTGKVAIPAHLVSDTKGLDDYRAATARHENKDFSLCLLFQKGRCNAGSRCHQVHACADYVLELRDKAASVRCCCAEHGDLHSHGYSNGQQTIRLVDHNVSPTAPAPVYALASFARTACLDNILRNVRVVDVRVPANKVCRLHAQRRCKFGKDCKNIHLCPDAVELPPQPAVKGCPSIDLSCGISCRSVSSAGTTSRPHSLAESPNETPRCTATAMLEKSCGAPLSIDGEFESRNGCSSFLYSDEKVWGAADGNELSVGVMSVELDMSLFEATMRSLCTDLERVEFSPACANRVQSLLLDEVQ